MPKRGGRRVPIIAPFQSFQKKTRTHKVANDETATPLGKIPKSKKTLSDVPRFYHKEGASPTDDRPAEEQSQKRDVPVHGELVQGEFVRILSVVVVKEHENEGSDEAGRPF